MITIEQMIQREVLCCMSSLVSTLAKGSAYLVHHESHRADYCGSNQGIEAVHLMYQASELAAPVPDYEEAAGQAGWMPGKDGVTHYMPKGGHGVGYADTTWQTLCERERIDPYEWEVYEHWAVTTWFAEQLIAQGERVDTDFAGLNIWARTTTGQAISMDGVVQKIYREMVK